MGIGNWELRRRCSHAISLVSPISPISPSFSQQAQLSSCIPVLPLPGEAL
ncbi:MAG: hypothetical protein F6K47_29415 [Symploca sp. SIO2E6]|nr:hypothetical protein [Symploca sp. SIO2E6]